MRPSSPRRVELGAESYNEQHRKGFNSVPRPTERFQARGVGPMRILEYHKHWILPSERFHLGNERSQRSLPAVLGAQIEFRIAPVDRQRQHLGKQGRIRSGGRGLRQHRVSFLKTLTAFPGLSRFGVC